MPLSLLRLLICALIALFVNMISFAAEKQFITQPIQLGLSDHVEQAQVSLFDNFNSLMRKLGLQSKAATQPKRLTSTKIVTQFVNKQVRLPHFSELSLSGPFRILIRPLKNKQRVLIRGPNETLARLLSILEGERLILSIEGANESAKAVDLVLETDRLNFLSYRGTGDLTMQGIAATNFSAYLETNGKVIIDSPKLGLNGLELNGSGDIHLKGISSQRLSIHSSGKDKVSIEGVAALQKLYFSGSSMLDLHWVNGKALAITGLGSAYAALSGRVAELTATLYNQAKLNARYLRAGQTFVKTYHSTEAHIYSVNKQSVFAADKSHVYYHQAPPLMSNHSVDQGSVLDIGSVLMAHPELAKHS